MIVLAVLASMRQVLLKYLDHNKVVKIPDDKKESDISYLSNHFRKLVAITFQRFHSDWGVFLDLEDSDETVDDRETLKVIVTTILTTPSTSDCSNKVGFVFV